MPEDEILGELRYIRWASWSERRSGKIGARQQAGIARGWLMAHPGYPHALVLTATGNLALDEAGAG